MPLSIPAATVGTPQQPIVPANQIGNVEKGAVSWDDSGMGTGVSASFSLPSAAGIGDFWSYMGFAQNLNRDVLPTGPWDFSPTRLATQAALANAVEQEWIADPASGHNTVVKQ